MSLCYNQWNITHFQLKYQVVKVTIVFDYSCMVLYFLITLLIFCILWMNCTIANIVNTICIRIFIEWFCFISKVFLFLIYDSPYKKQHVFGDFFLFCFIYIMVCFCTCRIDFKANLTYTNSFWKFSIHIKKSKGILKM